MKRAPYILLELLMLVKDGNMIICDQGSVNDCHAFKVNIFSDKEKSIIFEMSRQWMGVAEYNFTVDESLCKIAMRPKLMAEIAVLCDTIDQLHHKAYINKQ